MDWTQGYSARYYLSILDKETLRDIDRIEITGGSIKRSLTDLRESADLNCNHYQSDKEEYIRVWLDTNQNGESSHTPLFTGLATSPSNKYKGQILNNSVQCYSLLKIAQDVLLPRGWYAPTEANGGKLVKDLLSIIGVPIKMGENPPSLSQAIIAEGSENHLSMADKILDAMNWRLKLDGYGFIYLEPISKDAKTSFDSNFNDIIETEISITYDWYNAPNVVRAILDNDYAIARDDDPASPLSTISRGREVWVEDSNVQLNTNETLAEYSYRALREYQNIATNISYNRRYYPEIFPGDVIRINYPAQKIQGNFLIMDQSITIGYNATTSEEVYKL